MSIKAGAGGARAAGFSLLELLVVLAIVGILGALAIPSYRAYILGTHRTNAKAILGESAQYMERYFTANNSYEGATPMSAVAPKNASGRDVRYTISFSVEPDARKYTLQAVPAGAQADDACATLTLSSTGAQTPDSAGCW